MAPDVLAAIEQLLSAQGQVSGAPVDLSAAGVARMHSRVMPAARALAPSTVEPTLLPSEVAASQREALAGATLAIMTWLAQGLEQQQITDHVKVQQACELLCALSDLIFAAVGIWPGLVTRHDRTRAQEVKAATFMQLGSAGAILQALAGAARQLNVHLFKRAASMPAGLLFDASVSCQHMSRLLSGLWHALDPGPNVQGKDSEPCVKLTDWCMSTGLVTELAECALVLLSLDPAPYLANGRRLFSRLTAVVVITMNCTRELDSLVHSSSESYLNARMDFMGVPVVRVAAQGTSPHGTAPETFLRLSLVLLAINQYHKRTAALPRRALLNQARASKEAVQELRHAIKQQLTPSCCTQLLQRLVPGLWAVVTTHALSPQGRVLVLHDQEPLCTAAQEAINARGAHTIGPGERGWALWTMFRACSVSGLCYHALGPQELQLLMECAELQAATVHHTHPQPIHWHPLHTALKACPYPALVEFSTNHGHTLLTLAESSLAAATAAAVADDVGGSGGRQELLLDMTARLATCLGCCFSGGKRGHLHHQGTNSYEAYGYPADANWALLDPSTAPRLMRLLEAMVRTPGTNLFAWELLEALPSHLPEMQLFYSSPSTARATLSAVTSTIMWLQGWTMALAGLGQASTDAAAGAASTVTPRFVSAALARYTDNTQLWRHTAFQAPLLARFAARSLARAAALLDPSLHAGTAAAARAPAGRCSRAWLQEKALLAMQSTSTVGGSDAAALAAYKARLSSNPGLVGSILEQLQQGLKAQQQAAAARQAIKLSRRQGGDASELTEQLQALQLGGYSSSVGSGTSSAVADGTPLPAPATKGSTAGGASKKHLPAVTPSDITVASNALLMACKAAGVLPGVCQLLQQSCKAYTLQQQVLLTLLLSCLPEGTLEGWAQGGVQGGAGSSQGMHK